MNILPTFTEVPSLTDVEGLRQAHWDGLPHAQDALLEVLVSSGRYYVVSAKGRVVGYYIVHGGDTLIEYHVSPSFAVYAHLLLPQIVAEHGLRRALVKTFDHLFLAAALDLQVGVEVLGFLTREYLPRELPDVPRVRYTQRVATLDDLPRIQAVDQQVFSHPERLREVVQAGQMELFESDGALVGFGILRPVIPGRPDVELGIAVDAPFRNRGYAVYMLRDMAEQCLRQGGRPITGSSVHNKASMHMGLRVGFAPRYRLVELRFR